MNIGRSLARWCRRRQPTRRPRARRTDVPDLRATQDPDAPVRGCGWFDSSNDLRSGLAVIEGEALELRLAVERMLRP